MTSSSRFAFIAIAAAALPVTGASQGRAPADRVVAAQGHFVMVEHAVPSMENYGTIATPYVVEAKKRLAGIADVAVIGRVNTHLMLSDAPDETRSLGVSESTFNALSMIGVRPILGRDFVEGDAVPGGRTALLTYFGWRVMFNSQPDIIGKPLWWFNGSGPRERVTVVGVLPEDFFERVPAADRAAQALVVSTNRFDHVKAGDRWWPPIVVLRPGASPAAAQSAIDAAVIDVRNAIPSLATNKSGVRLVPADRPGWMKR